MGMALAVTHLQGVLQKWLTLLCSPDHTSCRVVCFKAFVRHICGTGDAQGRLDFMAASFNSFFKLQQCHLGFRSSKPCEVYVFAEELEATALRIRG
jgi:hypothetical protein